MNYTMQRYLTKIARNPIEKELHYKILRYITPRKSFSLAELQGELGLSYYEVNNAVEKMIAYDIVTYESGITFRLNPNEDDEEDFYKPARRSDEDPDAKAGRSVFQNFQRYLELRNRLNSKHDNDNNNGDEDDDDNSNDSDNSVDSDDSDDDNNNRYRSAIEKYEMMLHSLKESDNNDDDNNDDDDRNLLDEIDALFDDSCDSDDDNDDDNSDGDK